MVYSNLCGAVQDKQPMEGSLCTYMCV